VGLRWKTLSPIARIGMTVVKWLPAVTPAVTAVKVAVNLATRTRQVEAASSGQSGPEKKADVLAIMPPGPVREAAAEFVDAYVALLNLLAAVRVAVPRVRACVRRIRDAVKAVRAERAAEG
jgi:hypothetical protein